MSALGEITWWCPNRYDSEPLLWWLLDPNGGVARWRDAEAAVWDPCPAGPTARTTVRIGGRRYSLWDGLVERGDATVLVRLVRAETGRAVLGHHLRLGGFDRIHTDTRSCDVTAEAGAWHGVAVSATRDGRVDVGIADDRLVGLMQRAEQAAEHSIRDLRLPPDHPARVSDAMRVLRALTDLDTGAPVAAPTTSIPEVIGADRQFDYRFTWLRDSANASATASLLGHRDASRRYLDFIGYLLDRYGEHLTPLAATTRRSGTF